MAACVSFLSAPPRLTGPSSACCGAEAENVRARVGWCVVRVVCAWRPGRRANAPWPRRRNGEVRARESVGSHFSLSLRTTLSSHTTMPLPALSAPPKAGLATRPGGRAPGKLDRGEFREGRTRGGESFFFLASEFTRPTPSLSLHRLLRPPGRRQARWPIFCVRPVLARRQPGEQGEREMGIENGESKTWAAGRSRPDLTLLSLNLLSSLARPHSPPPSRPPRPPPPRPALPSAS